MNTQIEKIKSRLYDDLLELEAVGNDRERFTKMLSLIDLSVREINQIIRTIAFGSEEEEIYFFKHFKPEILARRFEEITRYNLSSNVPIGTTDSQLKYYEDELKAGQSYFRMNSFHYQYYKSGLTDLDRIYFLRDARPLTVPVTEFSETETEFSTPMSYLFAKFMAFEHIQYFILQQIAGLKFPEGRHSSDDKAGEELKWTGDSVNIVELAYGIWLTGQLNNGNASLNQIVRFLEANLHVNIGIIQRRFNEIERRKRLSPTKYIDQMKDSILQKIENGNS